MKETIRKFWAGTRIARFTKLVKRVRATEIYTRTTKTPEGKDVSYEFAFIPLGDVEGRFSLTISRCDLNNKTIQLVEKSIGATDYLRLRSKFVPNLERDSA